MVFSPSWSICLSADEPVVELGRGVALVPGDVVGVDAVCVDGVGTVEHAAIRRGTKTRKLATRRCPRRRRDRDRPMNVRTSFLLALDARKDRVITLWRQRKSITVPEFRWRSTK
jgi:hypothetical protein